MDAGPRPTGRAAFRGCLLGGAVGDALGAPIEFLGEQALLARHGPEGVRDYAPAYGRRGAITDDTQLTLFTAEALIRWARAPGRSAEALVAEGHAACLRWLATQGDPLDVRGGPGWLLGVRELHAQRAPGGTCLGALRSGKVGTAAAPLNGSKGCGGVMRMAPAGLAQLDDPFAAGCALAALTHGHPTGYLAAGYLAEVVDGLLRGACPEEACARADGRLAREPGHEETLAAVRAARARATEGPPSRRALRSLGEGWVAEEALAMGLYCALTAEDFERGVLRAVNHGGDSDSTGAIAGNLLGLMAGEEGIPGRWLAQLELREVVERVADELWAACGQDGAAPGARR